MNVCLDISTKRKKKGIEKGCFRQNWWILERSKGLCLIFVNEKLEKTFKFSKRSTIFALNNNNLNLCIGKK